MRGFTLYGRHCIHLYLIPADVPLLSREKKKTSWRICHIPSYSSAALQSVWVSTCMWLAAHSNSENPSGIFHTAEARSVIKHWKCNSISRGWNLQHKAAVFCSGVFLKWCLKSRVISSWANMSFPMVRCPKYSVLPVPHLPSPPWLMRTL